ncbi:MAG: hypothetical protein QXE25_02780, partial [Nitrososphaerota archaeon]
CEKYQKQSHATNRLSNLSSGLYIRLTRHSIMAPKNIPITSILFPAHRGMLLLKCFNTSLSDIPLTSIIWLFINQL